jgi:PAS domain S-box-containing protein
MDELLNNAPCGFLVFDDGGKIVEANVMLLEILGYERDELLALPIEKVFSVAARIFYQTNFFPLLKLNGKVKEVYLTLRSKNGENTPVMANAVRHKRGGVMFNDCVFIGMKQRDQYENEILSAKKEAETAVIAKDEFLMMISHELRTPLNSILGWANIIESGKLDPAGVNRASETIKRSAKAQSRLIEDILDYARIRAGKMTLEVSSIDLIKVVKEAIEIVVPATAAKNIKLETDLESEILILGDASRLQQVFWNLLSNAVKFTQKEGQIVVKSKIVGWQIEVGISDNGKGISAEFLPFMFERLHQADNSKNRQGGLGLGLGISRHIIELHGGTIRAESPGEGLGTTLTVSLPVQ